MRENGYQFIGNCYKNGIFKKLLPPPPAEYQDSASPKRAQPKKNILQVENNNIITKANSLCSPTGVLSPVSAESFTGNYSVINLTKIKISFSTPA